MAEMIRGYELLGEGLRAAQRAGRTAMRVVHFVGDRLDGAHGAWAAHADLRTPTRTVIIEPDTGENIILGEE